MSADEQYKRKLIERYVAGEASEKEMQAFFGLLTEAGIDDLIEENMDQEILSISEKRRSLKPVKRFKTWNYAAVVAGLLLSSYCGYYLYYKQKLPQLAQNQSQDIKPAHNQATLTLANGKKIILTKGLKGPLSKLGNTLISVNPGNSVTYTNHDGNNNKGKIGYNTMSTKKGEQSPYPLILADGTEVWLNAESSITFPTTFVGKNRVVSITGEAYFEVVHSKAHPFNVNVKGQIIRDIGTSFNINAYEDEQYVKTTLITGKIAVENNGHIAMLTPGQQAETSNLGEIHILQNTDIEGVLAWKNGLFKFDHANIKTIMRQLSRWYNVDVAYEGTIPPDGISGEIYRNVNASQALEILKDLNIHYRIENFKGINKIIIAP